MAHNHGNEYQVKIIYKDGTEELRGWMGCVEQVAAVMTAARSPYVRAYWLQERNILCPDCPNREQKIFEYLLTDRPSPRCGPPDSRHQRAVG